MANVRLVIESIRPEKGELLLVARELDQVADKQEKLTKKTEQSRAVFKDWGGNMLKSFGSAGPAASASFDDVVKKLGDVSKSLKDSGGHFDVFRKSITGAIGGKVGELLWGQFIKPLRDWPKDLDKVRASVTSMVSHFTAGANSARSSFSALGGKAGELTTSFGGIGKSLPIAPLGAFIGVLGVAAIAIGAVVAVVGIAHLAFAGLQAVFGGLRSLIVGSTKDTIAFSDKIGTLGERTDVSTDTLQILDIIARKSNTSVDSAAKAVSNMQAAIVKGDPVFKSLGLNFAELRKLSPEEAFFKVAKAIDSIGDAAGRTAARRDVLAKIGDEMAPLLATFAAGTGAVDRFGLALDAAGIKGAKALGDQLTDLDTVWAQFRRQLGDAVVKTGLVQRGVELLTGALGALGEWVRDNKDDVAGFFRMLAQGAVAGTGVAAGMALRLIPGGSAAMMAGRIWGSPGDDGRHRGPMPWGPGGSGQAGDLGPPARKGTYTSPEELKRLAEEAKKAAEEIRKMWDAVHDFEIATAQLAQKLNTAFFAELQRTNQQGNLIQGRGQFGPTGLGNYGQQLLAMYTSGLEKDLPQGRRVGGALMGFTSGGAGRASNTLAAKSTFDATNALRSFADVMQLVGGRASGTAQALGMVLGALAAVQGLPRVFGKGGVGLKGLDKNQKVQLGLGAIGAGAAAYQSGSAMGGAMGGAAFGFQVGGPWGAAIGGVAGGVLGLLGKGAAQRRELEALKKELTETYGSMEKLQKLAKPLGFDIDKAFASKNPKAAKEMIDQFNKSLEKTKTELGDWERGIVSASARAFAAANPDDKDVRGFIEKQREGAVSGLAAAFKGIGAPGARERAELKKYYDQMSAEIDAINKKAASEGPLSDAEQKRLESTKYNRWVTGGKLDQTGTGGVRMMTGEDARSQATIASVVFWDTFKTEGLVKAADAFAPIMENLKTSLAGIGGDAAAEAILGPIQTLIDLGTTNEAFRGATEGAQGLATTLDSLANRSIPLTSSQFGAFGQQAQSAFDQAKAAAIESGMSAADAQNAAIMSTAPLLQSLVGASQAYGFGLDDNTQQLLGMAEASGIAFKTESTDRLILAINALTTAMGGVPPVFETIGSSAATAASTASTSWDVATSTMLEASDTTGGKLYEIFSDTGADAATVFDEMTRDYERELGLWKGVTDIAVGEVQDSISLLPLDGIVIPIAFQAGDTPVFPGKFGWNDDGTPDNDGDKSNSFARGALNRFFPARRGGHWLNVGEGGLGEFVTVTHEPVSMSLGGRGITGRRVGAGVTHAMYGLWDWEPPFGSGPTGPVSPIDDSGPIDYGPGPSSSDSASALQSIVSDLQEAAAALLGAAEGAAAAPPVTLNASFSPQLVVQDQRLAPGRESNEQFDKILETTGSRLLRNANNQFRTALDRLIEDKVKAMR